MPVFKKLKSTLTRVPVCTGPGSHVRRPAGRLQKASNAIVAQAAFSADLAWCIVVSARLTINAEVDDEERSVKERRRRGAS